RLNGSSAACISTFIVGGAYLRTYAARSTRKCSWPNAHPSPARAAPHPPAFPPRSHAPRDRPPRRSAPRHQPPPTPSAAHTAPGRPTSRAGVHPAPRRRRGGTLSPPPSPHTPSVRPIPRTAPAHPAVARADPSSAPAADEYAPTTRLQTSPAHHAPERH